MDALVRNAWLVPFLPLLGGLIAAVGGKWLKQQSHLPVVVGIGLAFCVSLVLVASVGQTEVKPVPDRVAHDHRLGRADPVPGRRPDDDDAGDGHLRGHPGGDLRRRLHGGRPRLSPLLRDRRPVRLLDDGARPLGELPAHLPVLGRRGRLLVPPRRLLAQQARGGGGGQEGIPGESGRRRRVRHRHLLDVGRLADA